MLLFKVSQYFNLKNIRYWYCNTLIDTVLILVLQYIYKVLLTSPLFNIFNSFVLIKHQFYSFADIILSFYTCYLYTNYLYTYYYNTLNFYNYNICICLTMVQYTSKHSWSYSTKFVNFCNRFNLNSWKYIEKNEIISY